MRLTHYWQKLLLTPALLVAFLSSIALGNDEPAALKVSFTEVKPQSGLVFCNLFADENGFPGDPKKAKRSISVAVDGSDLICDFGQLEPGVYAVAAMHDENGNGKLDTNFIGIPKEGWAVSNNVGPGLFGPPSFKQASFEIVGSDSVQIKLDLRY
ncbi:MAG: DUF2141 domain-containing protein [Oligoflexus sp.]